MDDQELMRRLENAANAVSVDAPALGNVAVAQPSGPRPGWLGAGLAAIVLAGVTAVVLSRGDDQQQVATAPIESSAPTSAAGPAPTTGPSTVPTTTAPAGPADTSVATTFAPTESSDVESDAPPPTNEIERTIGDVTLRFSEGVVTYTGYLDQLQQAAAESTPVSLPNGVFFTPAPLELPQDCNYAVEGQLTVLGGGFPDTEPVGLNYTPGPADRPVFTWIPITSPRSGTYLVAIVRNGADGDSASLTAFGATDTVELKDGYAILMVPAPDGGAVYDDVLMSESAQMSVVVTTSSGTTVDAVATDLDTRARCSPPPMPSEGTQPDDPEATVRQIQTELDRLTDLSIPVDQKRSSLDDWTGVEAAASADGVADWSWKIKEHVFTSPTEMWFYYYAEGPTPEAMMEGYGVANLVDGQWQFRREMLCQNLLFAGRECGGGFGGIGPAAEALP